LIERGEYEELHEIIKRQRRQIRRFRRGVGGRGGIERARRRCYLAAIARRLG
jgi:hypothetical protein